MLEVCKFLVDNKIDISSTIVGAVKIVKKVVQAVVSIFKAHTVGVIIGSAAVLGITIGVAVGMYIGYCRVSSEYRHNSASLVRTLIDDCSSEAIYTTLNYIKANRTAYDKLMGSPKDGFEVGTDVIDIFYKTPQMRKIRAMYR